MPISAKSGVANLRPALSYKQRYKSVNKWWDFIVIIALQYILTTYFWIDYVNRTLSGPTVVRQSWIRPSCQNVWPPPR